MNILIADDEPIVLEGLKKIIDWEGYGFTICGVATNGLQALEMISELSPDLVLLDIQMPKLSGIEVARLSKEKEFYGKIIILSAFSDFEYAKNAIQHGVEAYLLKPVDENELIETICRIRDKLEEEKILSVYANQSFTKIKHNFLCDILTEKIAFDFDIISNYGINFNYSLFQIVVFEFLNSEIAPSMVKESILKICSNETHELLCINNSIVLLLKSHSCIHQFSKNFKQIFTTSNLILVFSDVSYSANQIPELYKACKVILTKKFFFLEDNNFINMQSVDKLKHKKSYVNLLLTIEKICAAIETSQHREICVILQEIKHILINKMYTVESTMQFLINLLVQVNLLIRQSLPHYAKHLLSENEVLNDLISKKTLYQCMNVLQKEFCRLCLVNADIHMDSITLKIVKYTNLHYNQKLTLEKLAIIFGYNTAYLGKTFKNEIGESFSTYLDAVRIKKQKLF